MLQNAYFLAKFGADTAENEQHFAEILTIGHRVADRRGPQGRRRCGWLRCGSGHGTSVGQRCETKLPGCGWNLKVWRARSRLYRRRFFQVDTRWSDESSLSRKWEVLVGKLSTRSTRSSHLCTAPKSKLRKMLHQIFENSWRFL